MILGRMRAPVAVTLRGATWEAVVMPPNDFANPGCMARLARSRCFERNMPWQNEVAGEGLTDGKR